MILENFELIQRGFLVATFDIVIPQWNGLELRECALFEKGEKRWVSLPSREFTNSEGKKCYKALVRFAPETAQSFQAKVLKLVDQELNTK